MKKLKAEELDWLSNAVDSEMSDAFNYASSELYKQMGESWRRYYRQSYNENGETEGDDGTDRFSTWVSPMVTSHVNDITAFVTANLFKNGRPIIKFRPRNVADVAAADEATDYVNYIFRHKLDGYKIITDTVFNAALLKICPVRVRMDKKVTSEVMKFEYTGYSIEEFEDQLATFFVANPELAEMDPDYIKEVGIDEPEENGYVYACYKYEMLEETERFPTIEVLSPGNFFVSRQAASLEDARMVAVMHSVLLSDLQTLYPDAPELNGKKSKKDKAQFWEELLSSYQNWYNDAEWLNKWSYDSLGYYQEEDAMDFGNLGLGSRKIFVTDAEIMVDDDDSGHSKLVHVVKAGNYVLHQQEISERSFLCTSMMPVAGKWVGLGVNDLVGMDAKEATINMRAFTDATVQAAHSNLVVDVDQMEMDDVENRGPDDILRRKSGLANPGVPAVEQLKFNGPDPSVLQAYQEFGLIGNSLTGVGSGFAGANKDDVSDMRVSTETANVIQNKSDLLLNHISRNYVNFLARVLNKLLNTAIKGNASPEIIAVADSWNEINPQNLRPRSDYVVTADIGMNDHQEKLEKLNSVMQFLTAASGGGGQAPDGTPIPQIPIQLTGKAGYLIAKQFFEVHELPDFEAIVIDPDLPEGQEQVSTVLNQIQQALPQMIQQAAAAAVEQANQAADAQDKLAKAEKTRAEIAKMEHDMEKEVYQEANSTEAEDRREDEAAMKFASDEERNSIEKLKVTEDVRLREKEMDLQHEIARKAEENKATAVVAP